jgi:hypothetical protein
MRFLLETHWLAGAGSRHTYSHKIMLSWGYTAENEFQEVDMGVYGEFLIIDLW